MLEQYIYSISTVRNTIVAASRGPMLYEVTILGSVSRLRQVVRHRHFLNIVVGNRYDIIFFHYRCRMYHIQPTSDDIVGYRTDIRTSIKLANLSYPEQSSDSYEAD